MAGKKNNASAKSANAKKAGHAASATTVKKETHGTNGTTGVSPKESAAEAPSMATNTSNSTTTGGGGGGGKPIVKSKFCINCQKDLTRNIRITCAECVSTTTSMPLIELCVECFGVGTELGDHKKTHTYTVSDCLAFPLVRERGVAPDVSGVAGILPNVTDKAAAVGATTAIDTASSSASGSAAATFTATDWTADEELLLLEGIEMFGMGNWKDIAEHVATKNEKKCESHYLTAYLAQKDLLPVFLDEPVEVEDADVKMVDAEDTTTAASASDPAAVARSTTTSTTAAAGTFTAELPTPSAPERPSGSELAGYMPLRGDFDVEYENEAELILADMEFSEDDHPTERELKLKVIEIYNSKLDERQRRKKFVIERGLLDYKKHQQHERRRPKDEREVVAQMRPFARFQSPKEHEEFVNGLITAMRLRKQILLLQEYRKNGVRTLAEAELYDVEKKKRETEQAIQKERDSASYLYESTRPVSGGRDRANRWQNRAGDTPNGSGESLPDSRGRSSSGKSSASSFNIEGTPGCHLLTPKERELCTTLKMLPKHYLVVKDALVRECYRLGYLTATAAKDIVKIDVNKTGQIYDFFVHCGWVRSEPTGTTFTIPAAAMAGLTRGKAPATPAATLTPAAQPSSATTTDSTVAATTTVAPAAETSSFTSNSSASTVSAPVSSDITAASTTATVDDKEPSVPNTVSKTGEGLSTAASTEKDANTPAVVPTSSPKPSQSPPAESNATNSGSTNSPGRNSHTPAKRKADDMSSAAPPPPSSSS